MQYSPILKFYQFTEIEHMYPVNAENFWLRYKNLTKKDLPVTLKTGIKQPTLATWKRKSMYPRADAACKIAEALDTSVEYLVTGKDTKQKTFPAEAIAIAIIAGRLSAEGFDILKRVASSLEVTHPKSG